MRSYFVYILKCSDDSYYTGISNDPIKREWEHNEGIIKNSYTHSRRPVSLIYSSEFNNVHDAISAEKQIKGWRRKKKEALINGNFDLLHELAKCKNNTSHLSK
jgi:putative endonuclease